MLTYKVVFWNVDTQKDFMLKSGSQYIPNAEDLIPNLKILTLMAYGYNIKVVNSADYHTNKSPEISNKPDGKYTFPPHCMTGTIGMDFIDETRPQINQDNFYTVGYKDNDVHVHLFDRARNIIIFKDSFNVFTANKLTERVVGLLNPELVVVYGVVTEFSVHYTVAGLLKLKRKVMVIEDAIAGLNKKVCEIIKYNWIVEGVSLVNTEDLKTILKN